MRKGLLIYPPTPVGFGTTKWLGFFCITNIPLMSKVQHIVFERNLRKQNYFSRFIRPSTVVLESRIIQNEVGRDVKSLRLSAM